MHAGGLSVGAGLAVCTSLRVAAGLRVAAAATLHREGAAAAAALHNDGLLLAFAAQGAAADADEDDEDDGQDDEEEDADDNGAAGEGVGRRALTQARAASTRAASARPARSRAPHMMMPVARPAATSTVGVLVGVQVVRVTMGPAHEPPRAESAHELEYDTMPQVDDAAHQPHDDPSAKQAACEVGTTPNVSMPHVSNTAMPTLVATQLRPYVVGFNVKQEKR